ncbi:MAG: hypothetical protein J6C91_00715 [Muribaculaceae bacterium]|nr:hypothetical protein [Muribaculaceae bacterium]
MKTKTFHKLYTTVIWLLLAVVSTNCTKTFDEPDLPTDIETRSGWDPGMTKKYFRLENIVSYIRISSNDIRTLNEQLKTIQNYNNVTYFPLCKLLNQQPISSIYYRTTPAVAAYSPTENAIWITQGDLPGISETQEELLHAGQDRVYPNGIGQYANKKGASNIEFEAKLIICIISLCNGEGYFSPLQPGERIDSPLQAAFHYWLDAIITNNGKSSFPSKEKVLTTTYNGYGYYDMLEEFILRNPAYNYPIDYTL